MLCELPLMPDSFRLQTAAIMRIMKGGVRLERYISKIQSRRTCMWSSGRMPGSRPARPTATVWASEGP
jgi:hypothetical protein